MTDNEIIKALEEWNKNNCEKVCPHLSICENCIVTVIKSALNLINSQKAEIERMRKHNKEFGFCNLLGNVLVYSKNLKDYNDMRKGLKSEAIKEFLKELEARCTKGGIYPEFVARTAENIVQEMTKKGEN